MDGTKTYHTVNLPTCVAVCGKKPKSMRETWLEIEKPNREFRYCVKCVKGGGI
ncbi:hypothetical protein D3C87_812840 [compost metagenome]